MFAVEDRRVKGLVCDIFDSAVRELRIQMVFVVVRGVLVSYVRVPAWTYLLIQE